MVLTPEFIVLTEEKRLGPNPGTTMAEVRTGTRCPAWSMVYPQIIPDVVPNTVSLPAVTMVFGYFSSLKSLMPSCSFGIISSSNKKWPDEPLSQVIANLSALG